MQANSFTIKNALSTHKVYPFLDKKTRQEPVIADLKSIVNYNHYSNKSVHKETPMFVNSLLNTASIM